MVGASKCHLLSVVMLFRAKTELTAGGSTNRHGIV